MRENENINQILVSDESFRMYVATTFTDLASKLEEVYKQATKTNGSVADALLKISELDRRRIGNESQIKTLIEKFPPLDNRLGELEGQMEGVMEFNVERREVLKQFRAVEETVKQHEKWKNETEALTREKEKNEMWERIKVLVYILAAAIGGALPHAKEIIQSLK